MYSYGVVPYLTRTTHPASKEYVVKDEEVKIGSKKTKYTIWEKEVCMYVCMCTTVYSYTLILYTLLL